MSLLDPPPVTAAELAGIEDGFQALLGTASHLVLPQTEATVVLEATAAGVAVPGSRALNVVSGPYGVVFGRWLRAHGATVTDLAVPFTGGIGTEALGEALAADAYDVVSLVHAEAATGGRSDLAALVPFLRSSTAITVVDAVASVGAEPLEIDGWGLDLVVLSAQKALAGPAGVSALSVSPRAWEWLAGNPGAPRGSALSLLDWRTHWIDTGRQVLPGIPSRLETRALAEALDRVQVEGGLPALVERHRRARDAARAGVRALGLLPWVPADAEAAAVATTVVLPSAAQARAAVAADTSGLLAPAPLGLPVEVLRMGHTGRSATLAGVLAALVALGGTGTVTGAALAAAAAAYSAAG